MDFPVHVDDWDLGTYPEKDPRDKKAGSDKFRLVVKLKNGEMDWFYTPRRRDGKMVDEKHQPKQFYVTGVGNVRKATVVSRIAPEDIRIAEERVGGKPSEIQMALWCYPVWDGSNKIVKWNRVDREKEVKPAAWRTIPIETYKEWRKDAYNEDFPDPYADRPWPTTRLQELESENKVAEKILSMNADLVEKNKTLAARLAELEAKLKDKK